MSENTNALKSNDERSDFFADIAAQDILYREGGLIEPQPQLLPDVDLPVEIESDAGVFDPVKRLASGDELDEELARVRDRYMPFMQRLDAPLETLRDRVYLDTFDWRMEGEGDRCDPHLAQAGGGEWTRVRIPHFEGPLGKATALYRTEIDVTPEQLGIGAALLCFNGVDYKANVFVNGYFVGSHEGFFAPFEFDVSSLLKVGANVVVVRVENDAVFNGNRAWGQNYSGDKIYAATGPGYDDPEFGWHHCPPGMGIYQKVFIEYRPTVHVGDIFVRPLLGENRVEVWLEVENTTMEDAGIKASVSIFGRNFRETVVEGQILNPEVVHDCGLGDTFQIAKAKAENKYQKAVPLKMERGVNYLRMSISMEEYRLWSLESPWLYQCKVELLDSNGVVLDRAEQHFGMRSFVMDEEAEMKGGLFLNGSPIRLRGANTMGHEQRCVMDEDWDQLRDDLLLAKICNMNFLRFTQRPVQEEVYTFCDMLGLMAQTDLPLFGVIRRNKYCEVLRQVEEMERLVRSHPCNIMVTYINEPTRNADNRPHRHIQRDEMEQLFSAATDIVHQLNPERVVKPCDGDYDPPSPGIQDRHCYPLWYNGHGMDIGKLHRGYWQPTKSGWYYGCGEFGAEGLESADLMRECYPEEWLKGADQSGAGWSPSDILWAQTGNYHYFFFDTQDTLDEWILASQEHQAFGTRIMTEAFRRDERMVTFAIHLFIDAFPAGWMKTIMDCRRRPKAAFFAYRDALAPLLPSLRSDRMTYASGSAVRLEAWVCNDLNESVSNLELKYYWKLGKRVLGSGRLPANAPVCHPTFQGFLSIDAPIVSERSQLSCHLAVVDAAENVLNDCELKVEVFPAIECEKGERLAVVGIVDGPAVRLARELGADLTDFDEAATIVIDDYSEYNLNRSSIDECVAKGARVVFLALEPGEYEIGGEQVRVKLSDFNPIYFASRKTGSEYVEGFKEKDFGYWYDPSLDRISHLLEATFTSPGFDPILTSGNTEGGKWRSVLAVGEKRVGSGSVIVCQVDLAGRTESNPVAGIFARSLLGLASVAIESKREIGLGNVPC
ncbi:beta galactosidase jelly roll domain-containing protein [Puniceicoccaceae bacterium K14]|nr:beta galactosidase jelly roll domain-containing protein [Puniceicoccaceae bacterium K14]